MECSLAECSRGADGGYDGGVRIGIFLLATRFPRPPETSRRAAGESAPDSGDAAALTRTVEAAVAAERAGFDDVWLAEHHFMSYGSSRRRRSWPGTCWPSPAGSAWGRR